MSLQEILDRIIENDNDVTFSGGDPLFSAKKLLPLAKEIRCRGLGLWIYTGFRWESLPEDAKELVTYADVLVDGPFIKELRDTTLLFRGSSNQRLIDVQRSLAEGEIILYKSTF